jgi:cytochrome c
MKKIIVIFSFSAIYFSSSAQSAKAPDDIQALLSKNNCVTCHKVDKKAVGPSWEDIAAKKYTNKRFAELVAKPEPANWPGYTPMTGLPKTPKADLTKIANWVKTLAK